jgi:AcrR family transcriptional regulator
VVADEHGLRARKKVQMRSHLVATAARLFAERGYEQVTVLDIARAAEVAEKTVYNYFPTKEGLVLDQDETEIDRIVVLLRERPPGTTPAAALRADLLALVSSIAGIPPDQLRGVIGYLAAVSPGIRRLCLEMTDRHARRMADVLLERMPRHAGEVTRARVEAHARNLAWLYQAVIDESGRQITAGATPAQVSARIRPIVRALLDDLEQAEVDSTLT